MDAIDVDLLEPACPFLGLAEDRRSRFTYPHPDHRCFAGGSPLTIDAARQSTLCLTLAFRSCDRFPPSAQPAGRPPAARRLLGGDAQGGR